MTKYKCPNPDCKYVTEEPGDCCGLALVEISHEEAEKLLAKPEQKGGCCSSETENKNSGGCCR